MNHKPSHLLIVIILAALLGACAKKPSRLPGPEASEQEEIADIRLFPQNLEVYAQKANPAKRILSGEKQNEMAHNFESIYFGPWSMKKISISRAESSAPLRRPGGYREDGSRWTSEQWSVFRANANMEHYPSKTAHAITLRQTSLREIPTNEIKSDIPAEDLDKYPFDYFQYSLLPPGMPLLIGHTSADGNWHYIECPIAGGWVNARDVAPVDDAFKALWRSGRYAALTMDNVTLPGTGERGADSKAGIGALLPLMDSAPGAKLKVLVPVREKNGFAGVAEIELDSQQACQQPLALTPGNVARIGNVMMGQPYGWGGTLGRRDCSAMIRDLFTPFGIWLPRNSAAQARRGEVMSLAGMSNDEKDAAILKNGVPFLSLVGLPGHITLYIGQWRNQAALFHNAWGLRVIRNGNDDERFVIGRAVVTSILPGMELPNLYRPRTFASRIRSLSTPGK